MRADAPREINVVFFFGERLANLAVLGVPVPLGIVITATAPAAVVIETVLQEDADRFGVALADQVGIDVPSQDVGEAADRADHFAKLVGPLPGDRERTDRSRAGPGDGPV